MVTRGDTISSSLYNSLEPSQKRNFALKHNLWNTPAQEVEDNDLLDIAVNVGAVVINAMLDGDISSSSSDSSTDSFDGFDGGSFGGAGAGSDF